MGQGSRTGCLALHFLPSNAQGARGEAGVEGFREVVRIPQAGVEQQNENPGRGEVPQDRAGIKTQVKVTIVLFAEQGAAYECVEVTRNMGFLDCAKFLKDGQVLWVNERRSFPSGFPPERFEIFPHVSPHKSCKIAFTILQRRL